MANLLLHIGCEKAGSTSFQAYLNNIKALDLPFDYFTGKGHLHSFYDYSLASEVALKGFPISDLNASFDYGVLDQRVKSIKNSLVPIIMSCELFYRNPAALRVFLSCCKKHSIDLCVLALVRSFSKYCRSLYGEAIKWGETEKPLKWARRTQNSLLSLESLSICSEFFPGKTFLWDFDALVDRIDWMDPILYLLDQTLMDSFGFEGFSPKHRDSLKIDAALNQAVDMRILAILRESNRSFQDPRLTRVLLRLLSDNENFRKALQTSFGDSAGSCRIKQEFDRLDQFTQSLEHMHAHSLAFSGSNTMHICI